jgi:hypothetical protein
MHRLALVLALAALALPAAGAAGGFATVGVAPLPGDIGAGDRWTPTLTILQHGRTPLDGLQPRLTIHSPGGGTHTFDARPTGEPGRYAVEVRFPSAGTWRYEVDDDFATTHTFAPVTVGTTAGSVRPWTVVLLAALAGVAAAAAGTLALRRRRPARATPAAA